MKILVTGAAGFIASYVSRKLLWRGDEVVGIDNFSDYYGRDCKEFNVDLTRLAAGLSPETYSNELISPVYTALVKYYPEATRVAQSNFVFEEVDITNYPLLEQLFALHQFDAVIHLGAMAGVPYSTKNPLLYTNVNVQGTTNLLDLCVKHGVKKFIFGSSSSVYGNRDDKKVEESDDVSRAVSVYGASKVAGEVISHAFTSVFDLAVTVIRIFGPIYGPLQRPYGMIHQRAINYVHNNKELTIYGKKGLETAKDSTYIDDEVNGILLALDADFKFEVFNIGTSNPLPISVWLDAIQKAYGKPVPYKIVDADKADVVSSANISKAQRMLNYNPQMDMYEGVRRQVEIFKLMPLWYQQMTNV